MCLNITKLEIVSATFQKTNSNTIKNRPKHHRLQSTIPSVISTICQHKAEIEMSRPNDCPKSHLQSHRAVERGCTPMVVPIATACGIPFRSAFTRTKSSSNMHFHDRHVVVQVTKRCIQFVLLEISSTLRPGKFFAKFSLSRYESKFELV